MPEEAQADPSFDSMAFLRTHLQSHVETLKQQELPRGTRRRLPAKVPDIFYRAHIALENYAKDREEAYNSAMELAGGASTVQPAAPYQLPAPAPFVMPLPYGMSVDTSDVAVPFSMTPTALSRMLNPDVIVGVRLG